MLLSIQMINTVLCKQSRSLQIATPENSGLNARVLECICQTLQSFPTVRRALLFGSRAKGNFSAGSDVDIALEGASTLVAMEIAACLNERLLLPYFFDVIAVEDIDEPMLREHIERVGMLLFQRTNDDKACLRNSPA